MFRFTIRDVLWLMLLVGVCLTEWRYHQWKLQEQRDFYWQALWDKKQQQAMPKQPDLLLQQKDEDQQKQIWYQHERILELERQLKARPAYSRSTPETPSEP